jgi:putative DNA primase/helicase
VDGAIEQAGHITRRPDFFAEAVHGLAFADGFVHAKPGGLEWSGHAPEHRARVGYPFAYPAEGARECPKFLAFLRSVWPVKLENEAGEPRTAEEIEWLGADQEAKILLCQQFLGASLVGIATRFQTALVLFGAGSNGKSTLIKTAEHLFPKGSLSHVAPQDLGDEYRLALLAGKLLNTVGELPTAAILDSARLKSVIDGTEITGRQIRQEPITFTPRAGMVYSANLWPPVADMSHGFWSRFAVLTFNEQFPRGTAGEDLDVIMAREEGPGIIAWMLGGAASVLKSRGYTVPASSGLALEEWRNQACTVAAFLRECCDVPPPTANKAQRASYEESAYKLFETYVRHTREGQRPPVSRQSFKNRMAGLGHPVKEKAAGNFYPVRLKLP